ncbi:hypothetical protein Hanom_Chr00s067305g01787551 [Helianthus anomalus]
MVLRATRLLQTANTSTQIHLRLRVMCSQIQSKKDRFVLQDLLEQIKLLKMSFR